MQFQRTFTRRRSGAVLALGGVLVATVTGVLAPSSATAAPGSAADAGKLVEEAAQRLTLIDEQVHEAELTVAAQQQAAAEAAAQAAKAEQVLATYGPRLRAIAQSGYTGQGQSRMAAFLTSDSAADVVQRMTTLDMIAAHTNSLVAEVAAAEDAAEQAQAAADAATATAQAGLAELAAQKAEVEKQAAAYQADFARLSASEQAAVTTAVAGRSLQAPADLTLPPGALGVAISTALAQVGDRYAGGAVGPDAFDCSGLTMYAFAAAGISLPHSSRAQSQLGAQVARGDLQAGDLVFFYSPISHVGIYLGGGMMVHARTYGAPVAVTSVDHMDFRFGVRL